MKTNWKSLSLAIIGAAGCTTLAGAPAQAQGISFGYSGPGVSVGVATGSPGYFGGVGYYGGGYYGGYPMVAQGPLIAAPVALLVVRRPVIMPGPWMGPRPVVVGRPYGWYGGPYRRYYRRY